MYELAINLPIHNEEKSIANVINEWVVELDKLNINYCLIASEDGSTDNTKAILAKLIGNNKKIINNIVDEKRGHSKTVTSGIMVANAKYILCIDSDGQCDPKDFSKFWNRRDELNNSILIGYRKNRKDNLLRRVCSKIFKIFHFCLFPNNIKDPSCPYVLFEKKTIENITVHLNYVEEAFWWLFVAACIKENINILQNEINHKLRFHGNTQVYKLYKFPTIFFKNCYGLLKLKLSKKIRND